MSRSPFRIPLTLQRDLGPFWGTREAAQALCCSTDEVHRLTRRRQLVAIANPEGSLAIPSWGVNGPSSKQRYATPLEGLVEVLEALERSTEDPWLRAWWLSGLLPAHRGWWAIEDLVAGGQPRVLERARNVDWSCLLG